MALNEVGAMLGLAALGGTWAVAWSARRAQLLERTAMLDARTQIHVRLDALRMRTSALARRDLPVEARRLVDEVVEQQVLILAQLSRAATVDDVTDLDAEVGGGFILIDEAAALVGAHMPAGAPFAGLCAIDPSHGTATVRVDQAGATISVCPDCALAAEGGELPARRRVTIAGQPVVFDDEAVTASRG